MKNNSPLKTRWTKEEDDVIRSIYPNRGLDGCVSKLKKNKRSASAIYGRARKLGLAQGGATLLVKAAVALLNTAQFAGERISEMNIASLADCHENSICTANLRGMVRLKMALRARRVL